MSLIIESFRGPYSFLSNFAASPFPDTGAPGLWYPTVEHFYQSRKTNNRLQRRMICSAKTPSEAKRLGKKVEIRPDWESIKVTVMHKGLLLKFLSNITLYRQLIQIPEDVIFIEGNNWHDNFWGICGCPKCPSNTGKNMLGQLIGIIKNHFHYIEVLCGIEESGQWLKTPSLLKTDR